VPPDSRVFATVEIRPANGSEERRRIPSIVHTFANNWFTLITGERLTASTAVAVEYNDVLFVGEVVRSVNWDSDGWATDIKVAQTLTGLESLMILRAELEQHQTQVNYAATEVLTAVLKR
jgi:hypothetical protein